MKLPRSVLREVTPPLLEQAFRRRRITRYESFDSALRKSGGSYENPGLAESIAAKTSAFADTLRDGKRLDMTALNVSVGLAALGGEGAHRVVIDVGGAAGFHYLVARQLLPATTALDWRIVETSTMASAASGGGLSEVSFYTGLDDATRGLPAPPDLLLASAVLQYVPDPLAYLRDLVGVGAKVLQIARTAFSTDGRQYVLLQRSSLSSNGPGPLPHGIKDKVLTYPTVYSPVEEVEKIVISRYDVSARIDEGLVDHVPQSIPAAMFGFLGRLRV